jgi:RHS repeat-associated protein
MYPGLHYAVCAYVSLYDAATYSDSDSTNNNVYVNDYYDACGTLVYHDTIYQNNGSYLSAALQLTSIVHDVATNRCMGTWHVDLTFTQTFTNGGTLTISTSKPFNVYPSKEAADADGATQPVPAGGPVDPAEQLGGSECEKPVRCKGVGDPVDTATGNFWQTFSDLSVPGRGPALELSRTYNSLAADTDGAFGFGWSSSYTMSLTADASTAVVRQASGALARFASNGASWSAPPRVLAALTHNADGTWTFTRRSREVFTFDVSGRLTAVADLNGYRATVDYPSASTMVVTDSAGRSFTFTFTGAHVTSVQDSSSPPRALSYGYDGAGNLTDVTDAGGGHWQFGYDDAHRVVTLRSPRFYGDTTTTPSPVLTNHYDSTGRVEWQTDQLGRLTTFDYISTSGSTKVTDPQGNTTIYGYTYGLLTTVTAGAGTPQSASWFYRYDPNTLGRISEFDPNGHTTASTYDGAGNLTSTTDGLGRTRTYSYNGLRQATSVTEAKRVNAQPITISVTYDSAGNTLTRSEPLLDASGVTTEMATTTYHHDDPAHPGDLTSATDPNGHTTFLGYDSFGDLTTITDPVGNITTHGYDTGRGWRTLTVSPKGNATGANAADYTTTYAYDAYGRPTATRDPMWTTAAPTKHQVLQHYDADGDLDSVTDSDGHTTTYGYNAAGERISATRPDGSTLRADYWPDGTLRRQYDGAGQATTYTYDPFGRLASVTDPLGRTTQLRYDAVGNLLTRTDPAGRTTQYTYDAANQLGAVDYSDAATPDVTNISYDADGQRTAMTDGTGTTTWTWDTLHRLASTTSGASRTVGYHYDLADRLTAIDYPNGTGTVTRDYDNADRLTAVTDWNSQQTTFGYDADSNLTSQTYPNGTAAVSTYDRAGRSVDIRHAPTANPAAPFASFGYGRSGGGLVTSVASTGVPADIHTYNYDSLDHLTGVDTATYGYDTADNLTKRLDNTQQVFDAGNQIAAAVTNPPISLVGTASAGDTTSNSLTLTLPIGTAMGDQVLLAVTLANGKSVTTPTGYTVVGTYTSGTSNTAAKVVLFRRTVATGDSSVTVGFQGKIAKTVALAVYRGVHITSPIDVTSSGSTTAGTSVTAASLAATAVRDRLIMVAGASGTAGTWSTPADLTTRVQKTGGTTDVAIADQALATGGASGTRTATHSTSTQLVGVLVALRPAQTSYGHDPQGNLTSVLPVTGTATTLGYDQANRLTAYGTTATYAYNGDGLRTAKTVSGTTSTFTWDTSDNLPLLLTDGATSYVYGPDGLPIEQITATGTLYYHEDQLGSTRALTNSTGSVVATYSYDPYGNPTGSTGTASNPFRYAGQYTDAESGYQYLRNRYYDPATVQFLTRDPLAALTHAPYSYANNSPLNETDPLGLLAAKTGKFLADHAGAVSETLAIATVTVDIMFPEFALLALGMGALSNTIGGLQTIKHISQGNYTDATVDAIALVPGVGGLGFGLRKYIFGKTAQLERWGKSLDAAAAGAGEVTMYEHPTEGAVPKC